MHAQPLAATAALFFTALLSSQNILTVGAGGTFADIQAAIDAAQPGDRIVVGGGFYPHFTLSKPLSIVGQVGFSVTAEGASFADLPAGTSTVVRGLDFGLSHQVTSLDIANCTGSVLIDEVAVTLATLSIGDSRQVLLNRSTVRPSPIVRSSVTLTDTTIQGVLQADQSSVWLSRCSIPNVLLFTPIQLSSTALTITGDSTTQVASAFAGASIAGSGTLVLDPEVRVLGSIAATITVTRRQVPSLAVQGSALGGTVSVYLLEQPGDPFALFVGFAGGPIPLPALGGEVWMAPGSILAVRAGTLDTTGSAQLSVPVPVAPGLLGASLAWVGVAGPTLATARLSNNAGYSHSQ